MLKTIRKLIDCERCGSKEFGIERVTTTYIPEAEEPENFDITNTLVIYCKNCNIPCGEVIESRNMIKP